MGLLRAGRLALFRMLMDTEHNRFTDHWNVLNLRKQIYVRDNNDSYNRALLNDQLKRSKSDPDLLEDLEGL